MSIDRLEMFKVRDVKTPTRGTSVAAGLDFYVPEDLTAEDMAKMAEKTGHELEYRLGENGFVEEMTLDWGQSACIPSGIKANIPHGYCMEFHNKSGIGVKKGLLAGACVTGDTLVETNRGNVRADALTKELCEVEGVLVRSWNLAEGKYEFAPCCGFRASKACACVRVRFDDGTEIAGAEDHMVYDRDARRWAPLKGLSALGGAKVASSEPLGELPVYSTNVERNANYVTAGGIVNKNCLIDEDYAGEWHIDVHNASRNPAVVRAGDKLAQFVMYRVEYPAPVLAASEEALFAGKETERGEGWAGSTGTR